ncbi:MAG TPA: DUF5631 domain-containing protein [Mycobacterium sp.]|nr:DUF5631 domain-containing protein [Mycobacterium sp.]
MLGADLPPGEWSAILIGGYWPGRGALEVLAAAAAGRRLSETRFHGYADHLRSISQAELGGQEGVTADAARSLFARGEDRARATAERNATKRQSYESAQHRVTALRDELTQIAADGNAAIRRIQESTSPLAAKVSGIVEIIADTHTLARTKTAESAGNLLADVQHVLDAQGADVSARAFATTHGIEPAPPRPPALDSLTQQVTARLEAPTTASPGGTESDPGAGAGNLTPGGQECAGNSGLPSREPSAVDAAGSMAARVAGPMAALTAGAGLLAAAGLTAGGTLGASATGDTDTPTGRTAPPAAPGSATTAVGAPAASPVAVPGSGTRPVSAGSPAAAPVPAAPMGSRPNAISPVRPGSAGGPHPLSTAGTSGAAGLIRKTASAVPGAAAERALAGTPTPVRTGRLAQVLTTVAGQEPRLRWAVGIRTDGGAVLATDIAGGWIPPGVRIPADVHLLAPGLRTGEPADLLSDCDPVVTYSPGQHLSPPLSAQSATLTMSATARDVAPVHDLGWELARATMWRDGLPRLAHTLARAVTAGTGWLESEADLLREHVDTAAARALAGYPAVVLSNEIGNWQLLATIAALVNGDAMAAAYHFAWFTAGTPASGSTR